MKTEYPLTDFHLRDELRDNWEAMNHAKSAKLEQFNKDKLGMFIHWGLYSLTSAEWNGQRTYGLGEWIMYHAQISKSEYQKLADRFNPDRFDAAEWVGLAKAAGFNYLVITSKHHDGFALFGSQYSDFTIKGATPSNLEPLDMLYDECQKQGIGFGLYYSHVIDWWDGWSGEGGNPDSSLDTRDRNKGNPMNTWDPSDNSRKAYFEDKGYPQLQEILERYPDLYLIWFDYWYKGKYINPPESYTFYRMVTEAQPNCLVNSRVAHDLGDYITQGDNEIPTEAEARPWETPGTLNNTWGYSRYDDDWKSEQELIYWIISIVSKGGNYLLNIGPKADGSIPAETTRCFQDIGKWMKVNSEAVYGTRTWDVTHEGPTNLVIDGTHTREEDGFSASFTPRDFWFTRKDSTIYAIALEWPKDGSALIPSISGTIGISIASVSMLGTDADVGWTLSAEGLTVSLPEVDLGTVGYVLKIAASFPSE